MNTPPPEGVNADETAKDKEFTAKTAENAKPKERPYKLGAGGGLFLLVNPDGRKYWRYKYRFAGKEKLLAVGVFHPKGKDGLTLGQAREVRAQAAQLLKAGKDPCLERKLQKLAETTANANSFQVVAREWCDKQAAIWAKTRLVKATWVLEKKLIPWLGLRPIGEITAPELLQVLRKIEGQGTVSSAHTARGVCGQVFRYAIATGRAERDPAADLRGALSKHKAKHLAAITNPKEVATLLRSIDTYDGTLVVCSALKLSALLLVRPGELRRMEWEEIDFEKAEWNIPAPKMKMDFAHLVPLPLQAVEILRALQPLTGRGKYALPSAHGKEKPMSENAVNLALHKLGYSNKHTAHGFRAMARTILDEVLNFRPDLIEHQLAHAVKDPNGRAYNRTAHLPARKEMLQAWADYLDGLRKGADVVSINSKRAAT